MRIKDHKREMFDLENGEFIGSNYEMDFDFYKGKSMPAPVVPPAVTPTAPIEEASVELDEEGKKKKVSSAGKSTLKVPLATSSSTGLKV